MFICTTFHIHAIPHPKYDNSGYDGIVLFYVGSIFELILLFLGVNGG